MPPGNKWAGQLIRDRRKELGISQKELADRVGHIDGSAISNIERGNVGLGRQRAERFERALNLPAGSLDGDPRPERPTLQTVLDRLEELARSQARHDDDLEQTRQAFLEVLGRVASQLDHLDERLAAISGQGTTAEQH